MTTLDPRGARSLCLLSALLTACSGSQTLPQSRGPALRTPSDGRRAARSGSWMLPAARSEDLIYASNMNGTVAVYSYRSGRLVGTLSGFKYPWGLCTDRAGDVYISDASASQVVEYAHGGTSPLRTLNDAPYDPADCSVDPVKGNIAVANFYTHDFSYPGNIAIFPPGNGNPKSYGGTLNLSFAALAYDDRGNLYVQGFPFGSSSYGIDFFELRRGGVTLRPFVISGPYSTNGGLQWDGEYLVVGDYYHTVYQLAIHRNVAKVKGVTHLGGPDVCACYFWIPRVGAAKRGQASRLLAPSAASGNTAVQVYRYPRGRAPMRSLHDNVHPMGVTLSLAPK